MTEDDTIDILVEIRIARPLSICVVPAGEVNALDPGDERTVWLPRSEILAWKHETKGRATLTLPRWLADRERLTPETAEDPNQGKLL